MTRSPPSPSRTALREQLLDARTQRAQSAGADTSHAALTRSLLEVLAQLEPGTLGVYWPIQGEFNAPAAVLADTRFNSTTLALPWAGKQPREMHYRVWDRRPPTESDACGIPTASGAKVLPDVILVPCVGYSSKGYRLGYGGGYFDRWIAEHPDVTVVGIAYASARVEFTPEPHDQRLMILVTDDGVLTID